MSLTPPWDLGGAYAVCVASMCPRDMGGGEWSPLGSSRPVFNDFRADTTLTERGVKPVRTPVAIFGSLGVCIYGPASRHWLISYSPIHLT